MKPSNSLIATAMVVAFVTTVIAQEWPLQLQDYIQQRVSKGVKPPKHGSAPDHATVIRWLVAQGAVWIILTFMVDVSDAEELAVALALVWMATVLMIHGPQAIQNIGFSVSSITSAQPAKATA